MVLVSNNLKTENVKSIYMQHISPKYSDIDTEDLGSGPGCSKLTMSLVKVFLKFQTLISQICQFFLLKKYEKLLQCKSFSHFFNKTISVYMVIKS